TVSAARSRGSPTGAGTSSATAPKSSPARPSWDCSSAFACCAVAAAESAQQRARHAADADQAGTRVGPDHGPHLRGEDRFGVEDLAAALDQPRGLLGRLDVLDDPAVGACVTQLLGVTDHA